MTQASSCGLLYAAAGMLLSSRQTTAPQMNQATSLRLSSDTKGLILSLCTRLLGLREIHSMAVCEAEGPHTAAGRSPTHTCWYTSWGTAINPQGAFRTWFFLMLSYSYQRDPPHPKCDLTRSFLSFATHSGKNPICRRNDNFILTKKCYVYIVDLRQRQFNTQGCFGSQRLQASGFRRGMSHNPGLHLPVRGAGWRWDILEFFRTNDTFQNDCNTTQWCHNSESHPNKDSTD